MKKWRSIGEAISGDIYAKNITSDEWNFVVGKGAILFEKLSKMTVVKLGDMADIFVGLQTSADDVFIMDLIEETSDTLRLRSKSLDTEWLFEKNLLFPIVSGTDVNRYATLPFRQYILFPYKVNDNSATLIDFKTIAENYPRTAAYLKESKKRLEEREHGKVKGPNWYGYIYRKNMTKQSIEKLCVPRLVEKLYAAYDMDGSHYLDNVDVGGITLKNEYHDQGLKYLLALLNSKLLRWYFPFVSAPFRGGWLSANRQFLSKLPIYLIDFFSPVEKTLHNKLVELVDQMLDLNKNLSEVIMADEREALEHKIKATDKQIDRLVYDLYDLTKEEIEIVEGNN